jgi:hypothetical protein
VQIHHGVNQWLENVSRDAGIKDTDEGNDYRKADKQFPCFGNRFGYRAGLDKK